MDEISEDAEMRNGHNAKYSRKNGSVCFAIRGLCGLVECHSLETHSESPSDSCAIDDSMSSIGAVAALAQNGPAR